MSIAQKQQQQQTIQSKHKDTAIGFIIGGLAACGAVTFTNPVEVKYRVFFYKCIDINK